MQGKQVPLLLSGLICGIGLLITFAVCQNAEEAARRDLRTAFSFQVRDRAQRIEQRLDTYEQVLRGAQGFLLASPSATREDFRMYVASLGLEQHHPGIQGLAMARIVPPEAREQHVAAMRAAGFPDYAIRPPGTRAILTAITQIEPATVRNLGVIGFDMFSEPVRRRAMERARDTGLPAISGKLTLEPDRGDADAAGFIMYLPIYARGLPVRNAAERQAAIRGWLYAPFRMNDFMAGLGEGRPSDIDYAIYDAGELSEQARMYASSRPSMYGEENGRKKAKPLFEATRQISVGGNIWTLATASRPAFDRRLDVSRPAFIAVAGIVVSLLLSLLVWVLATGRRRALGFVKAMTNELRRNEFRWKHALEGVGDGVWDWNIATGEVVYSRGWKEMLGYGEPDIEDRLTAWEDLMHPEDMPQARAVMREYLRGQRKMYAVEHRMRCRNGDWKWILSRGVVVHRDAEGKPVRMIGTHTDVTRMKDSEAALRESYAWIGAEQQRMKVILENSHDAFVAINADDVIVDWNIQAERTFGWTREEAVGRRLADLIVPEEQRARHAAGLLHFARTGTGPLVGQPIEVMALHRSGRSIPVEIAIAAVPEGDRFAANAFIRDITERKEAQRLEHERLHSLEEARAALQHAQKLEAVGKLTGGVAHDFNNVLQVIAGNLQLLQIQCEGDAQVGKRLESALNAVDRGAKLSTHLLAFARRQPLQPRVTHLDRLIYNLEDMLRQAMGAAIEIDVHAEESLWNTLIDPHQLENVILNLAINSRDAMQGKGRFTVALRNVVLDKDWVARRPDLAPGDYVEISIADTGSGMPPEVLAQAFEPFFTTKPEGQGTGLGLSMAYGYVKQSGGHIELESAPGAGTTIRIVLPRSLQSEAPVNGGTVQPTSGGDETILVVEDDLNVQTTVVAMLTELGYRVIKADDGERALEVLGSGQKIDLLFTDVVMPGALDGPALARQAKLLQPGLAVLFTSGYTRNAIRQQEFLDPEMRLLMKPYGREQLAAHIREGLADSRSAEALEEGMPTAR